MRHPALRHFRKLAALQARLRSDERGSILPLFVLTLVPLLTLTGVLVETSRAQNAKIDLQNAIDTAVLAAAKLNDADSTRVAIAERYFRGALPASFPGDVGMPVFRITGGSVEVTGQASATVRSVFGGMIGASDVEISASATALIAKPQVRHLDLVMCIDATGSMQNTIDAVKNTALRFETDLNAELQKRNIEKFDSMRVKPVFYRDYGGQTTVWDGRRYVTPSDPRDYGDRPPMKVSSFWRLPDQSASFSNFVSPEKASGGGDLPEAGLECVNEGINSAWIKTGATVASGPSVGKTITASFNVIAVWTDADAHPPSYSISLKNPDYPAANLMPRVWVGTPPVVGLTDKWKSAPNMDHLNQMLVFFGKANTTNWLPVSQWPNFFQGGTLTQGNTELVAKLADAIATKTKTPTLTH